MINVNDRKDIINPEILIVEDSPTQALELQYMLEKEGYSVLLAQNGIEALVLIGQSKPLIVISDIIMPQMDGYELCRRIKEDQSSKDIIVMLLTSLSDPEDILKSLACGADKFFTKPYNEEHLLLTVKNLLSTGNLFAISENNEYINVLYDGQPYTISSGRREIINLLISTYEAAVIKNRQLIKTQDALQGLNKNLEEIVKKRTDDLQAKNAELKLMTQQLWQAAKLATLGELAASIAHELNNPLTTISLRIESLMMALPPDTPHEKSLNIIQQEIERVGNLVSSLLEFSRRGQRNISSLNLQEEIEKTIELIEFHLRKQNIRVQKEFTPGLPLVQADRQQLRQLFLNLLTNAGDAMLDGGTLTIRVRAESRGQSARREAETEKQSDEARRTIDEFPIPDSLRGVGPSGPEAELRTPNFDPKGEAFVVIEFIDTGSGISPEDLPKVMEPFFTRKAEGKGTGLGLAICKRIVEDHKGDFEITSQLGKGTVICLVLPITNTVNVHNLRGIED